MAREVHGAGFDPSTEDNDGEVVMRVGGGKKHDRYWIADTTLDTASTPTLSQIRAKATNSASPLRPRSTAQQAQMETLRVQMEAELKAHQEEMEMRWHEEMERRLQTEQ
ncbi:unnamed protein product [Urochloa humidicola]